MNKIIARPLRTKDQTGQEMHRLIKRYNTDVDKIAITDGGNTVPFSRLPINQAFDVVKNIRYRRDNSPVEVVARPAIAMQNTDTGLDCKKKAIVLSSYLKRRGIPYRLVSTSRRRDGRIHHVFPQVKFGNGYLNLDATLPDYQPFTAKTGITRKEVLKDYDNGTEMLGFDPASLGALFKAAGSLAEPIMSIFGGGTSDAEKQVQLLQAQQAASAKNQQMMLMIGLPAAAILLTVLLTRQQPQQYRVPRR